jgi:hypothetical protein
MSPKALKEKTKTKRRTSSTDVRFQERIDRILAETERLGVDSSPLVEKSDEITSQAAASLELFAGVLTKLKTKERNAMLVRAARHWPIVHPAIVATMNQIRQRAPESPVTGLSPEAWLTNVGVMTTVNWMAEVATPKTEDADLARMVRLALFGSRDGSDSPGRPGPIAIVSPDNDESGDWPNVHGIGLEGFAILCDAHKRQQDGLKNRPSKVDCSRQNEAVAGALASGGKGNSSTKFLLRLGDSPVQLKFEYGSIQEGLVETLMTANPNLIRDWAALDYIQSAETDSPREAFLWTVYDHGAALGISDRKLRDRATRERILDRMRQLFALYMKGEKEQYPPNATRKEKSRIDRRNRRVDTTERPLVVIYGRAKKYIDKPDERQAAVDEMLRTNAERPSELVGFEIGRNPLVYRGVLRENGDHGRDWFPASRKLPTLPVGAVAIGYLCSIWWKWDIRRGQRYAARKAQDLLRWARIKYDSRRTDKAWARLERYLDQLVQVKHVGSWHWALNERQLDGVIHLYPHQNLLDVHMHSLQPLSPAPTTGAELLAWRQNKGLVQVEAAKLLGINARTIIRAEKAPEKKLGRSFQAVPVDRWT